MNIFCEDGVVDGLGDIMMGQRVILFTVGSIIIIILSLLLSLLLLF